MHSNKIYKLSPNMLLNSFSLAAAEGRRMILTKSFDVFQILIEFTENYGPRKSVVNLWARSQSVWSQ